jgi:hypothetical protein
LFVIPDGIEYISEESAYEGSASNRGSLFANEKVVLAALSLVMPTQ